MIKLLILTLGIHLLILTSVNGKLTILYQFALPDDLDSLRAKLSESGFETIQKSTGLISFTRQDTKVVTSRLGSNPYQATYLATASILREEPQLVITAGPCGALSEDVEIGSALIVTEVVVHDMATLANQGLSQPDKQLTVDLPPDFSNLSFEGQTVPAVTVASGSAFVAGTDARARIARRTGASVVDMNSFGSLYVFAQFDLASLNLRVVSDQAGENASEEFQSFVESYDGKLGKIAAGIILENPLSPSDLSPYPALKELIEKKTPEKQ
ncbi:MAG: hypothetical protein AAGJ81_15430 [Verrucomicrobiota bacterium]